MKKLACKLTPFVAFALLIGLVMASQPAAYAQETGQGDEPPVLTETMKALLADQQPAENRSAQAFTPCVGGNAGGYPCDNVDLLAFIPLATFSASSGNDIWGWTDPLNGKEYALMGLNNGTAFVDISDPVNPIYLGKLPTQTSSSTWRDIKVYNNYAFVVSEASGHGMQVFDLTRLRSVVGPPVTFTNDGYYSGFGNAHNIVINEDLGYAYAVGTGTCSGGLHMVNIQNPTNPVGAGCFSADGYTHDAQCVNYTGPDPDYAGSEICFNANEDTLTIVDVTNKAAPVQVSRTGYANDAYTHQVWVNDDHLYLLMDDELDEQNYGFNTRTRVWDLTDLDSPVLIGYHSGSTTAIDHNLYVKDGNAFLANYRAGLQILNLAGISSASLNQVGYFDIYPANNNANFNGAWNVFPYYDSGVVIVSGIEQGLFVLQPTLAPDFRFTAESASLAVCAPDSDSTTVNLTDINGYTGSATLSDSGLPAGSVASYNVNPVSVPGSSTITVDVSGTAAGAYPFVVTADDGSISHDINMTLNVATSPAGTATLLTPANGSINQPILPTFTWSSVSNAVAYSIEVASDAAFSNVVASASGIAGTSWISNVALNSSSTYFWRVWADNACGVGAYSAVWNFSTEAAPGDCAPGSTPNIVYATGFESGAGGWISSGTGNTWAISGANPHAGSQAFHADGVGAVSDQRLVSPAMVLPVGQNPITLKFWNYQELEDRAGGCFDGGILEISTDGGATFTQVSNANLLTDPYDGPISAQLRQPAGQPGCLVRRPAGISEQHRGCQQLCRPDGAVPLPPGHRQLGQSPRLGHRRCGGPDLRSPDSGGAEQHRRQRKPVPAPGRWPAAGRGSCGWHQHGCCSRLRPAQAPVVLQLAAARRGAKTLRAFDAPGGIPGRERFGLLDRRPVFAAATAEVYNRARTHANSHLFPTRTVPIVWLPPTVRLKTVPRRKRPVKTPARKLMPFVAIALLIGLVMAGQPAAYAQEPAQGDSPPVLTETMKALLADQQPAENRVAAGCDTLCWRLCRRLSLRERRSAGVHAALNLWLQQRQR